MHGLTITTLALVASLHLGHVAASHHEAHFKHRHQARAEPAQPASPTLMIVYKQMVRVSAGQTTTLPATSFSQYLITPSGQNAANADVTGSSTATETVVAPVPPPSVSANALGANAYAAGGGGDRDDKLKTTTTTSAAASEAASGDIVSSATAPAVYGEVMSGETVSSATAPAGSSPPSSAPPTGDGGKKGFAWNDESSSQLAPFKGKVTWSQNWNASPMDKLKPLFATVGEHDYAPSIWGDKGAGDTAEWAHAYDDFVDNTNAYFDAFSPSEKMVLTFNEPDMAQFIDGNPTGASDVKPDRAATIFREKILDTGFHTKYVVVSPAVTSDVTGIPWLQDWKAACPECVAACQYTGAHYFHGACEASTAAEDAKAMMAHFTKLYNEMGQKPLVVSEVGCLGGSGAAAFQAAVIAELKGAGDMIRKWAWFGAILNSPGSLITGDQKLKDQWLAA